MNTPDINKDIFKLSQAEFPYIQKVRRHIHKHPEIGFEVHETARFIASELASFGNLEIKTQVGQTGIVADLNIKGATKRIALRADMDALPMEEQNTCDYRSVNKGKAHMCGHDAHSAMLLGAARILAKNSDQLSASVRFIFQPNEESYPGGAPAMIDDNALLGVDEIYGMHVWPLIPVKHYGLVRGAAMGKPDVFKIKIQGVGGHASIPHKAIDPIVIGAQIIMALQTIISRNVNFQDAAVLSVTQFHAGTTHNVIPDKAFIEGTLRTFDDQLSLDILTRIKEILLGFEKAFQVTTEFELLPGYPVLFNHDESVTYTEQCLKSLLPEKEIKSYQAPNTLGGEDFAYYLEKIPGCYVFLGCANVEKGITNICHDPKFEIDEDCLVYGTALHCQWALNFGK